MKTCSMCGTLLFDDVIICTKCGHNLTEGDKGESAEEQKEEVKEGVVKEVEPSSESESEQDDQQKEKVETKEEEPPLKEGESSDSNEIEDSVADSSEKRQKWLEEQDKIKAELASIMSRVGKKRAPMQPGQVGYSPVTSQIQVRVTQDPFSKPVGVSPQINPLGHQTVVTIPQPVPQDAMAQSALGPTAGQDQTPGSVPGLEPQQTGGLSDFDKQELLRELDDLRNEGYNVSRLEKIIEEDPGNAWKSFSEFLDDIEQINQLRSNLEGVNTEGLPQLATRKNEILLKMNNPDSLSEIKNEISEFEKQVSEAKIQAPTPTPTPPATPGAPVKDKKAEQLEKFIALGKDAIKQKDYNKALRIFTKTLELDPNNKEILFFKKKLEVKIVETKTSSEQTQDQFSTQPSASYPAESQTAPVPQPQAVVTVQPGLGPQLQTTPQVQGQVPSQPQAVSMSPDEVGKKKKKKKKKIITQKPQVEMQPVSVPTVPSPQPLPAQTVDVENGEFDGPKTAAEFEALGFNAYINKDYPKALEFFEKVLEIDPNFPNVENLKNECLMRLGKG